MLHSPLILVFSSTSVGLRLFDSLHFPLHFSAVLAFGCVRLHDQNNQEKKHAIMNFTTDLLLQYPNLFLLPSKCFEILMLKELKPL